MANPIPHDYDASAHILSGHLHLPLMQEIKPQAHVNLRKEGGYLSEHALDYRLESVISFSAAHTQVAGNRDPKTGHGWSTLTTSVVENLNVLEVVTADRVVGQIATEHPLDGYVPRVTFLATRFDNLRIAGHPVHLKLNNGILGDKPQSDGSYTREAGVLQRVGDHYDNIRKQQNVPAEILQRYNQFPSTLNGRETVECSLVTQIDGSFPGKCYGHVIDVPDFGKVYLAVVRVEHWDWKADATQTPKQSQISLTMIELELGCPIAGHTVIGQSVTNGMPTGG